MEKQTELSSIGSEGPTLSSWKTEDLLRWITKRYQELMDLQSHATSLRLKCQDMCTLAKQSLNNSDTASELIDALLTSVRELDLATTQGVENSARDLSGLIRILIVRKSTNGENKLYPNANESHTV